MEKQWHTEYKEITLTRAQHQKILEYTSKLEKRVEEATLKIIVELHSYDNPNEYLVSTNNFEPKPLLGVSSANFKTIRDILIEGFQTDNVRCSLEKENEELKAKIELLEFTLEGEKNSKPSTKASKKSLRDRLDQLYKDKPWIKNI